MNPKCILKGNPDPARSVSSAEQTIMNPHPAAILPTLDQSLYLLVKFLINRRLRQTNTMIPTELESTFEVSSNTFSALRDCCE